MLLLLDSNYCHSKSAVLRCELDIVENEHKYEINENIKLMKKQLIELEDFTTRIKLINF